MDIKEKLRLHSMYLRGEPGGVRANLQGANLQVANLRGADLRGVDLQGANLWVVDLRGANLQGANLRGADLRGADLWVVDLQGVNLQGANLQGANLRGADLGGADLRGADLGGADLRGADLGDADLRGADLQGANGLHPLVAARLCITPQGDLIGWKKCTWGVIVKLRIPAAAKRCNATGRKCRAEYAETLEVFGATEGVSQHDGVTRYVAGMTTRCDKWGEDRWEECSGGIHFFLTREEAEDY